MRRQSIHTAQATALGGVMAALAVTVMCVVGLIPLATYISPLICILILDFVRKKCGSRIAWAWWAAVSFLSILLGPDKEAGFLFLFLGYYPMIRVKLQGMKGAFLLKFAVFNASTLLMYWLLIRFFGMEQLAQEFEEMGRVTLGATLVMGNFNFFLLDRILTKGLRFRGRPA